jgi:hypothetical protein
LGEYSIFSPQKKCLYNTIVGNEIQREHLVEHDPIKLVLILHQHITLAAVSLVNSIWRTPADQLKVTLQVIEVQVVPNKVATGTVSAEVDARNRSILAVVSYKDEWKPTEEGWCVFLSSLLR